MAETTADILIDTIHAWGLDTIFGLPGDGIDGIMEASRKRQDKIRFVQVRHKEAPVAPARSAPFPAISPPWPMASPMRSRPSSLFPSAKWWPLSTMSASRC
jgi:hypothetical protein